MSNIIELCDTRPVPYRPHPYPASLRDSGCALVIDNGSYQCRAGWAFDFAANLPQQPSIEFRNLIAKPRRDRNNRDAAIAALLPPIQVGNDISNIEAMRFQLKTQFDRNVVTHLHNTEQIFDYVLRNLGVGGSAADAGLPHPVVLTEALANPNYSRQQMSELLFECYAVPRVAYGIDALFSLEHSHPGAANALIVSFGQHTTHVIPWLDGRAHLSRARRLNLGGAQMTNYLHRLLQLKYPVHSAAITLSRAEWLVHTQGQVATDYAAALRQWSGLEYYERHVRRVQLPYAVAAARAETAASVAERTGRRREMAKRLADANAKRRDEKLAEAELMLQRLMEVRELGPGGGEEFELAVAQMELGSTAEVEKQIQLTAAKIARTRGKIAAAAAAAIVAADSAEDAGRAGVGSGQQQQPALAPPPDGLTIADWVRQTRGKRADILERRQARRQRRQDLAKRRTAAAQERMRVISRLARKEKGNDDFGARDEDWDVYKQIRRDTGDSDSEAEQERLVECEEVLRQHDPDFERLVGGGLGSLGGGFGGFGYGAGAHGAGGSGAMLAAGLAAENPAELYQLHVGVEAIRCTEIIFQPSLVGCPEAGLAEIVEFVLRQFSADEQLAIVANVFVTGGCSKFPGLNDRLTRELREIRPFGSAFHLSAATQPAQDAWLGAQQVAMDAANAQDIYVTRAEYAEKGGEYLREHRWGNQFHATPAPIVESSGEQN